MMMTGDPPGANPTVHLPTLELYDDHPTAPFHHSPFSFTSQSNDDSFTALQRYLPSNTVSVTVPDDVVTGGDDFVIPVDTFSSDEFRMYEFKVRKCTRARSHDWTECPYAHPGEKARRRDPRKFHYSGNACPEFRKGSCRKGDSCEYAHGVFECWLHPARYRTQPCKDGTHCRRRICFFAHTPDQLRLLSPSEMYDGSPARIGFNPPRLLRLGSSPTSVLHSPPLSPPSDSPPLSPIRSFNLNTVNSLADSMRSIQIGSRRLNSSSLSLPWGIQMSPRSPIPVRPGFMSLPTTPNRVQNPTRSGLTVFDMWEDKCFEEEPAMERVESGKILRAKIYSKLSMENSLDSSANSGPGSSTGPDIGWISELVK